MPSTDFTQILQRLHQWRDEVELDLHTPDDAAAVQLKLQLEEAIGCLQLCMRYAISSRSRVTQIPLPRTMSAASEFRLVEDHETDNRESWEEVRVDGETIRPLPKSIIVEPRPDTRGTKRVD